MRKYNPGVASFMYDYDPESEELAYYLASEVDAEIGRLTEELHQTNDELRRVYEARDDLRDTLRHAHAEIARLTTEREMACRDC